MSEIFVFGSNLQGIHGKGAALYAKKHHGAIQGQAFGLQGNSYAIPTKRTPYQSLDLITINRYVADFIEFASWAEEDAIEYHFKVTPIGCGLAGYNYFEIAPMFSLAQSLSNITLPPEFTVFLSN